jgi:hypothetical protein
MSVVAAAVIVTGFASTYGPKVLSGSTRRRIHPAYAAPG